MEHPNLIAAWIGILCGFVAGAATGLFYDNETWLGGYASWPRRLVRLGHISFFGIAFINLAYALSVRYLELNHPSHWPSILFIAGAIGMPLVCYLAAWRKPLRHLFAIPVACLLTGTILFLVKDILS